jgi:hypothetical protein
LSYPSSLKVAQVAFKIDHLEPGTQDIWTCFPGVKITWEKPSYKRWFLYGLDHRRYWPFHHTGVSQQAPLETTYYNQLHQHPCPFPEPGLASLCYRDRIIADRSHETVVR